MRGRGRLLIVVGAGMAAYFGGCCVAGGLGPRPDDWPPARAAEVADLYPLPHHVPKNPGGLSFRFAMAHDVIHERYPRHGPAFHRERERLARAKLADVDHNDRAAFPVLDDLASSLWGQGRSDEAVQVMRDKLARQQRAGVDGKNLYTSYANLGTYLIYAILRPAAAGDVWAKERFREGVGLVRRAIAVNPEAHFGREQWEATRAEFLLAAMDDPGLLTKLDFVGDRLDARVADLLQYVPQLSTYAHSADKAPPYGRAYRPDYWMAKYEVRALSQPDVALDDPARWAEFRPLREYITPVGAEQGWNAVKVPSHPKPVPFDEPALGIVGLWRQGAGADPHLALALGEIMLRVGQRFIAWAAFERASRLADRFSPDPAVQQSLRVHCRQRQEGIERLLKVTSRGSWRKAEELIRGLRPRFESELAFGERYQRAYQEYEAARIASGADINDDHFYDEFNAGREPIASRAGPEEWFAVTSGSKWLTLHIRQMLAWGALAAGVGAMGAALLLRRKAGRPHAA